MGSISIVSVACTKIAETIDAIRETVKLFPRPAILITHEDLDLLDIKVIKIKKLDYKGYNEFVAMKLWKHVDTDYCLLVQNDGWVLNPEKWEDNWLNYDYIGAGWPVPPESDKVSYRTANGDLIRVGNGGFSLRSRKLLEMPTLLRLDFNEKWAGFPTEDGWLCVHHREKLEKAGIKFAPLEEAIKFSRELPIPELLDRNTFGFHRYL